jgi:phage tail P2-like protein
MSADLLPPYATKQERALANTVSRISNIPVRIKDLWNPQTCPIGILPWLAWSLSVDDWNSSWSEQQKRNAVAASVQVHRTKGTIGALKRALEALGYEVFIDESGAAYTFRLLVNVAGQTYESSFGEEVFQQIENTGLKTKNARSYLSGVNPFIYSQNELTFAGVLSAGCNVCIYPEEIPEPEFEGTLYIGGATFSTMTIDLNYFVEPEAPFKTIDGAQRMGLDGVPFSYLT